MSFYKITVSLRHQSQTDMSVRVEHLNKSYGSTPVLRDVSFFIPSGEIVGLLGPNGAGKSTLMKLLIGLLEPDDPQDGCPVPVIERPQPIGYLPELNPLYNEMYVREYLLFMAGLTHSEGEVESLIERVGLTSEVSKRIAMLSKGYKQRVGLAQALLGKPQLLILDEPTTGLDPNQLNDIRRLIREEEGKCTVILSTHILQEVEQMCSRVIILDGGTIRANRKMSEIGSLEQLFQQATTWKE